MSAGIGAHIVHAAVALGARPGALEAATGFDPAAAKDPDAQITLEIEEALWNEGARLCGDDALGLHAAELLVAGIFDVLDYAVRSAPTLRASLERLVRYNRLVHDAAEFTLIERGDVVRVEHAFRFAAAVQCRHSAEFTLAAIVVLANQLTGTPVRPGAVDFRHGKPASETALVEHARIFGVAPRFAQRVNALELDRRVLERTLPSADPALSRVIERHAEALLAARPDPARGTADRVRHLLSRALGEGEATLATVADRLHMSERSLQRKLADDGVTFDALLDELRRDLALRYLADPKIAIAEVAYLLGYSEPSPFHRAFKRWTGVTPSEARRRAA
jgi:AraC-like DNA-binding protein